MTNADRFVRKLDLADRVSSAPKKALRSHYEVLAERISQLRRAYASLSAAVEAAESTLADRGNRKPNETV